MTSNIVYKTGYDIALTAMINESYYLPKRAVEYFNPSLSYQQHCKAWALMFLLAGYDVNTWEFNSGKTKKDILSNMNKIEVPVLLTEQFKEKQKAVASLKKMYDGLFPSFLKDNYIYFKIIRDSVTWPEGELEVFFESYDYKYLYIKLNLSQMEVSSQYGKQEFDTYIRLLSAVECEIEERLL